MNLELTPLPPERAEEIQTQAEGLSKVPFPFEVRQGIDDLPINERLVFWSTYLMCVGGMIHASCGGLNAEVGKASVLAILKTAEGEFQKFTPGQEPT